MTFAVARIVIVTGAGPHEKRIVPPARTAATTPAEVQLDGVPRPTTRTGVAVAAGRPAAAERSVPGRGDEPAAGTTDTPAARAHRQTIRSGERRGTDEA